MKLGRKNIFYSSGDTARFWEGGGGSGLAEASWLVLRYDWLPLGHSEGGGVAISNSLVERGIVIVVGRA